MNTFVNRWNCRFLFAFAGIAFIAAGAHALAQEMTFQSTDKQAALIELYSSEGCSSCPPAEEWLGQLKRGPNLWKQIVPVDFHVDYWDNLGWPDRFAKPEYTRRQRDYAAQLGQDSIYTPEFIVNGREWRGWFGRQAAPAASGENVGTLKVTVKEAGHRVEATFTPAGQQPRGPFHLEVALLGSDLVSHVQRGENEGRTLKHEFVALSFISVPMTASENGVEQGAGQMPASNTADKPAAIAAWIVADGGAFVQATGGWLDSTANTPGLEGGPR